VQAFANQTQAERGVRHARINLVTVKPGDAHRMPGYHHHHLGHLHLIPNS
jgi:hypothetical protein